LFAYLFKTSRAQKEQAPLLTMIVQCSHEPEGTSRINIKEPMYCGPSMYGEPWFLDVGGHVTTFEEG